MDVLVRSVVSQLLSIVSSEVLSSIKQQAAKQEATALVGVIEGKLDDMIGKIRRASQPDSTFVYSESESFLMGIGEEKVEKSGDEMMQSLLVVAKAATEFLVRYPEAKAGRDNFKDLVCDISSAISDVVPELERVGAPAEAVQIGTFLLSQSEHFVSEGRAEEGATMLYDLVKSLVVTNPSAYQEVC